MMQSTLPPLPSLNISPSASQPGCCSCPAGCPPPGTHRTLLQGTNPASQKAGSLSLLRPVLGLGNICPVQVRGWEAACGMASRETLQQTLQDSAWGRDVAGSWLWGPATHPSTDTSTVGAARSSYTAWRVPLRLWHGTECHLPPGPPTSWFPRERRAAVLSSGHGKALCKGETHT